MCCAQCSSPRPARRAGPTASRSGSSCCATASRRARPRRSSVRRPAGSGAQSTRPTGTPAVQACATTRRSVRRRAPRTASHPARGLHRGDDHARQTGRPARSGAASSPSRARVRRGMGTAGGLGDRPTRHLVHGGRSASCLRCVAHSPVRACNISSSTGSSASRMWTIVKSRSSGPIVAMIRPRAAPSASSS